SSRPGREEDVSTRATASVARPRAAAAVLHEGYARRAKAWSTFGRGFDSRRLHQISGRPGHSPRSAYFAKLHSKLRLFRRVVLHAGRANKPADSAQRLAKSLLGPALVNAMVSETSKSDRGRPVFFSALPAAISEKAVCYSRRISWLPP